MESSEAGLEEIEEATPRPKGTKKKEDLDDEDEGGVTGDEDEFKTPRTLRKINSRKTFVVYSTEESDSEVGDSEVETQRQDKGKEREKEQLKVCKIAP